MYTVSEKITLRPAVIAYMILLLSLSLSACAVDAWGATYFSSAHPVQSSASGLDSTPASHHGSPRGNGPETLYLSEQDGTFLSLIEATMGELGPPKERSYLEVVTAGGILWQGERLAYPGKDVLFLQQSASDNGLAVRWDAPVGVNQDAILSVLPKANAVEGAPADVVVQFVRARLSRQKERPDSATDWTFDVTIAHPDTGWDDYADGWHVETINGQILGTRILLHPHVDEQPFTRSLSHVLVPRGINEVRIRTHDLVSGYGRIAVTIPLDMPTAGDDYTVER